MLQGTKISSIDDLREPCKDLIDKFSEDAAARALITDCGKTVLDAIDSKTLLEIEGEEKKDFELYEFANCEEFEKFFEDKKNDPYRYKNCRVIIKESFIETSTRKGSLYSSQPYNLYLNQRRDLCDMDDGASDYESFKATDQQFGYSSRSIPLSINDSLELSKITPTLNLDHNVFNSDNRISLENGYLEDTYLSRIGCKISEYEFLKSDGSLRAADELIGLEELVKTVQETCSYSTFKEDAKRGRFFFYCTSFSTGSNSEVLRTTLKKKYDGRYNLTKAKITGRVGGHFFIKVENIEHTVLDMPEEIKGMPYDIDHYIEIERQASKQNTEDGNSY